MDFEITLSYDEDDQSADSSTYCDEGDLERLIDEDQEFQALLSALTARYAELATDFFKE